ncbi:MAG: AGE family epimerase/isomerase [Planctomycetota bacterium]
MDRSTIADAGRAAVLRDTYRRGLLDDVVPFWLRHGLDHEHGGVLTCLDRDGSVYDTDKSIWFQGRFGWLLGTLFTEVEPRDEWLDGCRSCVTFLRRHGFDADGRMFFAVTRDGRPLRKRRYVFSEMFAALALAAWGAAAADVDSAREAIELFERAATRLDSPGGIEPKLVATTRATTSFSGPMIVLGTAQGLRRALARLGGATGSAIAALDGRIDAAIAAIRTRFVRPELEAVLETVRADGTTFLGHADGRLVNPGHAIEGAWFVMEEGRHRGDRELVELGATMLRWSWRLGWDDRFGGIRYFQDVAGKPPTEYWHDMKFWWPHAEAIIATLSAWSLTGDATFARWHADVHDWAFRHFADPDHGEWYGWLQRDGTPTHLAKGSLWKGPFHLPRMHLVCWRLTEEILDRQRRA